MSLRESIVQDLPHIYKELADAQVVFRGSSIYAFFDDNYDVESMRQKVLRVQEGDVAGITNDDTIEIDGVAHKVIMFEKTADGLEMIVGVEK